MKYWVKDSQGNTTIHHDQQSILDALIKKGITDPAPQGFTTLDNGITITWGIVPPPVGRKAKR